MSSLYSTAGQAVTLYTTDGVAVLGGDPGTTPDPTPALDPARLTERRHVVDACASFRTSKDAGVQGGHSVHRHSVHAPAKALQVAYGHEEAAATSAHGGRGYAGQGWLVINGQTFPLTWDGQTHLTIPFGEHRVSDPLPEQLVVHPGDTIYSVWQADPGTVWDLGETKLAGSHSAAYVGAWGGRTSVSSGAISGSPLTITGLTLPEAERVLSVNVVGDSFSEQGWPRRAVHANGYAWADYSRWLGAIATTRRVNQYGTEGPIPFDLVISGYGGNTRNQTLLEQQVNHLAYWRWLDRPIVAMSLHPYTNSTDGWTTLEGQSKQMTTQEDVRIARNEWLRDGAPLIPDDTPAPTGSTDPTVIRTGDPGHPLVGLIDQADWSESSRNSGLWRVDGGAWTSDGTHLSGRGIDGMAELATAWVAAHLP